MRKISIISIVVASALLLSACAAPAPDMGLSTPPADFEISEELLNLPSVADVVPGDNLNAKPPFEYTTLEEYYSQDITWGDCAGIYKCAPIFAPMDWDNPTKGMVYIALFMLPATSPHPKGSLLVNPGGPGASGIDIVYFAGEQIVTEEVRENYNLVGFDPRGVGFSDSVYCGPDSLLDIAFLAPGIVSDLGSDKDIAESRKVAEKLAEGCSNGTGELLEYLDTASSAKDMDLIREVLGDDKLNYLGFSYGTQLGATYAALFPDKVGRLVLDGAVNPTHTPEEGTIGQAAGFELAFNNYVKDCLDKGNCPLPGKTVEEVLEEVKSLLLRLETNPLPTNLDMELGVWGGLVGIIANLYSRGSWNTLTTALKSAYEGDGTELLESAYRYYNRTSEGTYNSRMPVSNVSINCADGRYSQDPTVIRETNDAIQKATPTFGRYFSDPHISCFGWKHEPRPSHELDFGVKLARPVLVIGTTGDPATPYKNAIDLANILNQGVLITFEGEGHTVYANQSSCIDKIVDDYLIRDIIPKNGIVCSN
jgi:pimeloyl-ACP methyl ester carboxylesterase